MTAGRKSNPKPVSEARATRSSRHAKSIRDLPRKAAASEITGMASASDRRSSHACGPDWSSGYRSWRLRPIQAIDIASSSATTVSGSSGVDALMGYRC